MAESTESTDPIVYAREKVLHDDCLVELYPQGINYPRLAKQQTESTKRVPAPSHFVYRSPSERAQERGRVAHAEWLRARLWRRVGSVAFLFGWIAIHWWFATRV